MPNAALQIPFVSGQKNDIDEAIMPDGMLAEVLNLRQDRSGAWKKRKPYSGLQLSTTQTGPIVSLARLAEQRLVIAGAPPTVLQVQYDSAIRHFGTRCLPWFDAAQRETLVTDLDENVLDCSIARATGWTVVVYSLGGYVKSVLLRDSDGSIARFETLDSADCSNPQVVACGSDIIAVWHDTSGGLEARVMDTSGAGVPTWGSTFTIDATTNGLFDLDDLGGDLLITHQRTATTMRTEVRSSPYTSASATDDQTVASGSHQPTVEGEVGEKVWVAWVINGTGAVQVVTMNTDLSSPSAITTVQTDSDNESRVSLARYSATSRLLCWGGYDATGLEGYVRFVHIDSAAAAGTVRSRYGVRLMSQLFMLSGKDFGSNETFAFCIVTNDAETAVSGSGESTRTYFALMFSESAAHDDFYPFQSSFCRDVAAQPTDALKLSKVATATSGGETSHTFAGLTYVRGLPDSDPVVGLAIWRWKSTGYDRLRPAEMGGGLYFSGGILSKWDGANAYEAGWLGAPDIISLAASNGAGALTSGATYSYVAVLESTTQDGERVQSTPSLVATVALGSTDDTVTVVIRDMKIHAAHAGTGITVLTHLHLYRTLANEETLRRITPAQGLPVGALITVSGSISYTDLKSDTTIETGEVLYTEGGILPHGPPPPCRFMAKVGQRLWTGGGENPLQFLCTKEYVGGEPPQFVAEINPDDPQFGALVDEPGTAIADLDGTPVLFTRRNIWLVLGDGPDDQGSGEFRLQKLPSDFGCTDHRPVATCAKGVVFRSTRGIELLPRGQGEPEWIGAAVADLLDTYPNVTSVAVLDRDQSVRWTAHDGAGNGCVLVWNMTFGTWSYYTNLASDNAEYELGAEWDGNHAVATADMGDTSPVRLEQNSGVEAVYTVSRIRLGHLTLDGISKYHKAKSVVANLRFQAGCDVVISVEYDGDTSATDSHTFTLSGLTAGNVYPIEFALPRQKVDRIQITIYDTESLGTQGVDYLGMVVNYKPKTGHRRLAAVYRG